MASAKKDEPKTETEASAAPPASDGASLVRKLSPKTVCGKVKLPTKKGKGYDADGKEIEIDVPYSATLYTVIGVSHGIKTGTGDNGPWVAFLGSFEATRHSDGAVFQAGQCFIPKAVEDLLVSAMRAGQKDDPQASVQFAIEVGIKPADTAVGYEYTVKNLVKTQNADPLALLRNQMKALAAPSK
jgi:hypothetical protein